MEVLKKVLISLLVISIGFNVFLLIALNKNIIIDRKQITNVHNHQEQFQGQLQMNMWMARGDKLKWIIQNAKNKNEVINILNLLPFQYSFFSKIVIDNKFEEKYTIFIPVFMQKK